MIDFKRYRFLALACLLFVIVAWLLSFVSHSTRLLFNNSGRERVQAVLESWERWEPQLLEHEIKDMSPEFSVQQQLSDIFIYQDNYGSCLGIAGNDIIFLGGVKEDSGVSLVSLDAKTGRLRWQADTKMMSTFAYDGNYIYGDVNNGLVAAYDIKSGEVVWQERLPRGNSVLYVVVTTSQLYVEMIPAASYILDVNTGIVQQTFSTSEGTPTFLIRDKIRYWKPLPESMQATNVGTGITLWSAQFGGQIVQTPVFQDDLIVVKTGQSTVGDVYALEAATGEIIWQVDSIASNVSISNNIAYYLTTQAQLRAVDIRTGETIGIVNFVPNFRELSAQDLSNRPFYVAAYGETVVVYFGDSRQLFIFRFSPGE